MIPLEYYLYVAAFLFCVGVVLVLTKRNAIVVLMGIELIFNAANINLVAFSQYDPTHLQGQVFSLFVIVIAAAEATIALAIVLKVYQRFKTIRLDDLNELKG
ncbi:NADH-quinone oxidoreductase subunit NuoK [Microscilla marina]|uniref:NADH-quinone oxidoreductase subunit K n=1 Tax=Microscilla marina ATCC 23134 TaxID=313606 RepID=A1ZLZ0_MICM2|nr:NADH-quinone oxidoreductase subunit NuoK [Microscilla marina]EAY28522.1 NAD(P)H-quinone oxidoreductase chain 4L (NAD(P)Hdehydrogenase I, chain 4L) [Microscilla marina ATCC 23134]